MDGVGKVAVKMLHCSGQNQQQQDAFINEVLFIGFSVSSSVICLLHAVCSLSLSLSHSHTQWSMFSMHCDQCTEKQAAGKQGLA